MTRINNLDLYLYATKLHARLKKIPQLTYREKYTHDVLRISDPTIKFETPGEIHLQNDAVQQLDKDNDDELNTLIVCQANEKQACGNWDSYVSGYEENLSYRSTLPMALVDSDYPIRHDEAIYCPNVCFFRDHNYCLLNKSIKVAVIAITSVKRPDFSIENDAQKVRNKLEMIFLAAIKHRHTSIIINNFGCEDDNDPEEVAKILKTLFELYKYNIRRLTVIFEHTGNDPHYLMFKKIFSK